MDFRRALAIIEKRRWIIIISVVVTTALVYGVTRLMPSRWQASVRLITPSASAMPSTLPKAADGSEPDGAAAARVYAVLAHSKEVMSAAAQETHLNDPLQKLATNIELEAAGAHMFELRYFDSEPGRAGKMANALADNLVSQNRGHNSAEALRAVKLLEQQLRTSEDELRALQSQYDKYCIDNQIIPGDFLSQVKGVARDIEVAQTSAEEARARIAQNRARLAGLKNSPAAPPTAERPVPLSDRETRVTRQIEDLDTEIHQLRRRYNDTYPELKSRLEERASLEAELNGERLKHSHAQVPSSPDQSSGGRAILDVIAADEALIQSEEMTIAARKGDLDRLKRVNSKLGNLPSLITEKSENRSGIAARLNSAKAALDVAERQNPLTVLEYSGETYPPINTTAGRALKFVGLGALCAFVVAAALAIFLETSDRRLKTVQEAEELLPARVLAAIPQLRDENPSLEWARMADRRPLSPQSEAYRFLAQHVLSVQNRRFRTLMALSARSGQGNTRMMCNLAITLAQAGHRVILVDANLRHPVIHSVFEIDNQTGLTEVLKNPETQIIEDALQQTTVPNLRVLTSGSPSGNPWELFSSHRLDDFNSNLRGLADYVLYDTPSALAYTDTLSLSTIADALLLCVRAVDPITGAEHRLGDMFALSDVHIMGSVLMDAPPALIGSHDREIRDTVPVTRASVPALEAGDASATHSAPAGFTVYAAEPEAAASTALADEPAPVSVAATDTSQDGSMDPVFEVTETRLSAEAVSRPVPSAEPAEEESPAPVMVEAQSEPTARIEPIAGPMSAATETREPELAAADETAAEPIFAEAEAPFLAAVADEAPQRSAHEEAPSRESSRDVVKVRMVSIDHDEDKMSKSDYVREEISMAGPSETPPGGFPKSIHGYNVGAVDDYVRKINSRLESLLSQVQAESSRADQSKRLLEQMTSELETLRRRASDAEKRELIALEGQKRSEEEAARLALDVKDAREKVRGELEGALADARQERDTLLDEERQDAEALVAETRRAAQAQVEEAHRMLDPLQKDAARMKAELETLRALTADPNFKESGYAELLHTAEAHRERLEAEVEAERAYARTQIELVVTEARRNAEEAGARAAAVYREHEDRIRELGVECEALVLRIKEAVEAQLNQIPTFSRRAPIGVGGRPGLRTEESDEKRIRDNREWRSGDWRNAS